MLEGLHRLDSFLLSHIFSHLHDGPQLARLRRVCVRWREVIDEDKRLWKELLLREFNWRKQGGRGKGSAKRHRKIQNYQQHYVLLHRNRMTAARDEGLKKRARMEKVARILRVVVPQVYDWQMGEHSDQRHPWKMCAHLPECVKLHTNERVWCECRACGAVVGISDWAQFQGHYPQVLDITLHCEANRARVRHFAGCLRLVTRREADGYDLENGAYATYSAFLLDPIGALADC